MEPDFARKFLVTDTGLKFADFLTEYRGVLSFPPAPATSFLLVSVSEPKLPSMPATRADSSSTDSRSWWSVAYFVPFILCVASVVACQTSES